MKNFLIVLLPCLALAFEPNPGLTDLPDNTALDLGPYSCSARTGYSNCAGITDYSGFTYDTDNHQMLMFGGGHATTFRDDVDHFSLDSLTWRNHYMPTPCGDMTVDNMHPYGHWKSTGHPYSVHTYDKLVYAPNIKKLILFVRNSSSGKGYCAPDPWNPGGETRIHHYDPVTYTWTVSKAQAIGGYGASEFDPVSGKFVYVDQNGLWTYDPVNEVTIQHKSYISGAMGYANNLVYFPPNDRMYFIARGNPTTVFEMTLDRNNWANTTFVPVTGISGTAPNTSEAGWAYDAASQVIGGGVKNNLFNVFDPVAKSWQSLTPNVRSSSRDTVPQMAFHALDYDPVNNVFIFMTGSGGSSTKTIWAYRYKAGTTGAERGANIQAGMTLNASPNPFKAKININYELQIMNYELKDVHLAIYDINGRCIKDFSDKIHNSSFIICNSSSWPVGVYLIRAEIAGRTLTKRIVLQK